MIPVWAGTTAKRATCRDVGKDVWVGITIVGKEEHPAEAARGLSPGRARQSLRADIRRNVLQDRCQAALQVLETRIRFARLLVHV
jgi:hypothetical protein